MQDAVLAMLARCPSHGYELQSRLQHILGPAAPGPNAGQIYVTLGRLERAGLVAVVDVTRDGGPERKVYGLTESGRERVRSWSETVSWPRANLAEFHLKLCLVAQADLADPVEIVHRHRREVLYRLQEVQRARLSSPDATPTSLLLEGLAIQLDAELRWLDACAGHWEHASRARHASRDRDVAGDGHASRDREE